MQNATVAYRNENGELKGMVCAENGDLENLFIRLRAQFVADGYDAIVNQIDEGIARGLEADIDSEDFGYEITKEGVFLKHAREFTDDEIDHVNTIFGAIDLDEYDANVDALDAELAITVYRIARDRV